MYKFLILCFLIVLTSCKEGYKSYVDYVDDKNGYTEEKVVLDSFFRRFARNVNQNVDTVFTYYSQDYIAKLNQYVHFALYGEKSLLQKLDFTTQSKALTLRHKVPVDLLLSKDLVEITKKNQELSVVLISPDAEVVDIIFETPNKAYFVYKSVLSSGSVLFTKDNGEWKMDPEGDPIVQSILREKAFDHFKSSGHTEENVLQYIVTGDFNGEINWEPLVKQ